MVTASFSGELNHEIVRHWAASITDSPDTEIRLDLNEVTFAGPYGMASLAAWIERLLISQRNVSVTAERSVCFEYMQNMNLFNLFHIHEVEQFNRHPQRARFARMMRIDWQSNSSSIAREIRDCLEVEEPAVRGDLFTCLEESITNLWAHAAAPGFAVAQSYERGSPSCRYEIAIVDRGMGIREGLLKNTDYSGLIPDDVTALSKACESGISGAKYRYPNDQQHFGLGLFHIDRMTESVGGVFQLCSGNACRRRDGMNVSVFTTPYWQGTIAIVTVDPRRFCKSAGFPASTGRTSVWLMQLSSRFWKLWT